MLTRRIKLTAVLGVLATASSAAVGVHSAFADTAQNEARAIRSAYAKRDAAANRRDFDAYWQLRTDNFVWISKDGRRKNTNQLKEESARMFSAVESMNGRTTVEKITLNGNTATVLTRESGTFVIPVSATKKNVFKVSGRSSDTWIKRNGRWLQSQGRSLSAYVTLNGKPVKY